jgi:PIN domain nuclease of toxin-antitoxin system
MRLPLDTHVLIWWRLNDPKLSPAALVLILDRSNQLLLSSVSGFEIATKVAIGKLQLAATAKLHSLTLVTLNTKHFPMLTGIHVPYTKP